MYYNGIAKHFDDFTKEQRQEIIKHPHHIEFYREPEGIVMVIRPITPQYIENKEELK